MNGYISLRAIQEHCDTFSTMIPFQNSRGDRKWRKDVLKPALLLDVFFIF